MPPRNGSHRNVLRGNDCSFSPNNAIEVDLVDDTLIEGNNCSHSNYGMWLGYSRRCKVRNNICINDSSKAVEIENGQDDVFENNVFGYDTPRADNALVYLRQNGRDTTPSGPYTFEGNVFYGAKMPVTVTNTPQIELSHTLAVYPERIPGVLTEQGKPDNFPVFSGSGNLVGEKFETLPAPTLIGGTLTAGKLHALTAGGAVSGRTCFVEVDGIPPWTRRVEQGQIWFWMPADFWERPAQQVTNLRVFTGRGWTEPLTVPIAWPNNKIPRIDSITPNPAQLTDNVTITGVNLDLPGTEILFNNKPGTVLESSGNKLTVKLPAGIVTSARYNVLVRRGEGKSEACSWPVTFRVQVSNDKQPHSQ